MSRGFDCSSDLKKDVDVWKIGFRVLDSWIVTASNGNQHMELIIGDAKGDWIHAITRYKDLEARVYMLENPKKFDLVDLDPYGSPSVYLDLAVQSVADGGILMCDATDMAVLRGSNGKI